VRKGQPLQTAVTHKLGLQVDLGEAKAVTAVMTQGVSRYLRNQYLTQFIVKYSKDGDLWINYRNSRSIQVKAGIRLS